MGSGFMVKGDSGAFRVGRGMSIWAFGRVFQTSMAVGTVFQQYSGFPTAYLKPTGLL